MQFLLSRFNLKVSSIYLLFPFVGRERETASDVLFKRVVFPVGVHALLLKPVKATAFQFPSILSIRWNGI